MFRAAPVEKQRSRARFTSVRDSVSSAYWDPRIGCSEDSSVQRRLVLKSMLCHLLSLWSSHISGVHVSGRVSICATVTGRLHGGGLDELERELRDHHLAGSEVQGTPCPAKRCTFADVHETCFELINFARSPSFCHALSECKKHPLRARSQAEASGLVTASRRIYQVVVPDRGTMCGTVIVWGSGFEGSRVAPGRRV